MNACITFKMCLEKQEAIECIYVLIIYSVIHYELGLLETTAVKNLLTYKPCQLAQVLFALVS